MNQKTTKPKANRPGIILVVVLGMLTFFSIMVAAYLVFSSESREASFAISQREIRDPDIDWIMNEALMTMVRGTSDTNSPFYGEDLLSDYYGTKDRLTVSIIEAAVGFPASNPQYARIGIGVQNRPSELLSVNDAYTGRLVTFLAEDTNLYKTYRILRSEYVSDTRDYIFLRFDGDFDLGDIESGATAWVNGRPRNGIGIGYSSNGAGTFQQADRDAYPGMNLPVALQPNHITNGSLDKGAYAGDFDEEYDAADFNNWFLSHRNADGTIIPSFHRPSVINYLLNQSDASDYQLLLSSIRRATFRPLPINQGDLGGNPTLNGRFTGGSSSYALRTALPIQGSEARLNQVVEALINGQWDVDNDSDGEPDSVWVDLGLPAFVSREGKLIRPLVAPIIEDLSGRLNLNAHSNRELIQLANTAGIVPNQQVKYGKRINAAGVIPPTELFRGIGWGPAEISLPQIIGDDGVDLANLRYTYGQNRANFAPGNVGRDALDTLGSGFRPPRHQVMGGFGYPTDPFGRSGVGIGLSGHVLTAPQGFANLSREDVNHPYESDPSGQLAGDSAFTFAELESIVRSNDFDSEILPPELRTRLFNLLSNQPSYREAFTTQSSSDDSPVSSFLSLLLDAYPNLLGNTQSQANGIDEDQNGTPDDPLELQNQKVNALVAPELRLGRKIDVNRPFGNLVDDDDDSIIDEPNEEAAGNYPAFRLAQNASGAIPNDFANTTPNYRRDEPVQPNDQIPVTGRQLLARHLYVLLMALRPQTQNNETAKLPMLQQDPDSDTQELYTARRLAQWAVNVVDYRDPDSIMTRFAFDPNPFDADGWSVNDTINDPHDPQYVVWGVEEPQLLFSEGLALHDVRVRDTNRDSTGEYKKEDKQDREDETTDQVRLPQGSLFLELYCPHPVANAQQPINAEPGFPMEFYSNTPSGPKLDLSKRAGNANGGAPVWRIAISERHDRLTVPEKQNASPEALRNRLFDSASFEVQHPDEIAPLPAPNDRLTFERFILFTSAAVPQDNNPEGFFNQIAAVVNGNQISDMQPQQVFVAPTFQNSPVNANRLLEPGQFLVLAPRLNTHLGSSFAFGNPNSNAGGNGNGNAFGLRNNISPAGPSDQRFFLDPQQGLLTHYGTNDVSVTPQLSAGGAGSQYGARALPLVIAAPRTTGWVPTSYENGVVGLNISEPMPRSGDYYPEPTLRYFDDQVFPDGGSYPLTDAYIDFTRPDRTARNTPVDANNPFVPSVEEEPILGTLENYRSAYLQRLADPTLPYNAVTNPYRTVDWLPLDLTVFSGEEREDFVNEGEQINYARRSRQKNGRTRSSNPSQTNSLFTYESSSDDGNKNVDAIAFSGGGIGEYFKFESEFDGDNGNVFSSLSFLNTIHPIANPNPNQDPDVEFYDAPLGTLAQGMDANLPRTPYARHVWLNRPFASHHELMMVPACSAGRLSEEFSMVSEVNPEIYPDPNGGGGIDVSQAPFRHLLNFFYSAEPATDENSLELARLFEFVHTLPRFRGEVDYLDPVLLDPAQMNSVPREFRSFHQSRQAPFNFAYDNQRQATINLNTVSSSPVWTGLMQGHLNGNELTADLQSSGPLGYQDFLENRQGYPNANQVTNVVQSPPGSGSIRYQIGLDPRFPTRFAGVFRSALNASNAITPDLERIGVNAGLLRDTANVSSTTPSQRPLFVRPDGNAGANGDHPAVDRSRNSLMRYQTLMRMPNLTSNNSQVFLIRMTVGFFEVDASDQSLGREYNAESGSNQRYQATFVVDRSIPVGFEPGKDLNARDVVVFESYAQ